MALDFTPFFQRYEAVLSKVDETFVQIQEQTGDLVHCAQGCCDCCYALFDLTLLEAMYISHHFRASFSGMQKSSIMERADKADREVNRLKRQLFKASQQGISTEEILAQVAQSKLRCPLLGENDLCEMYEYRPLTCRAYGVPTAFGGQVHTCGKSGFEQGNPYPTIQIEKLQDSLMSMSLELAGGINTRYKELGSILMPVSMALLTDFDEDFLGIMVAKGDSSAASCASASGCASCSEQEGSSACASCKDSSFSITLGKNSEED